MNPVDLYYWSVILSYCYYDNLFLSSHCCFCVSQHVKDRLPLIKQADTGVLSDVNPLPNPE